MCPVIQDNLGRYIFHNGSFFHSCGNPMERVLMFSFFSIRTKRRLEKLPFAAIDCSKYARQHNWWYNLLGRKLPITTHEEGKYSGIIGIVGKRLFQIRAWWAQAFLNTAIHFIQFSLQSYPWNYKTTWIVYQKKLPPMSSMLVETMERYSCYSIRL